MKSDDLPLTEVQSLILSCLLKVHELCDQKQIQYYIIGGTLIGAIRHGGFIPWDDDIDIGLPRADYERLLKVAPEIGEGYKISHSENDPGYIYTYAKCYDINTTITELTVSPFTRGAWIDIFPIDGTFDSPFLRKLHFASVHALKVILACKKKSYFRKRGLDGVVDFTIRKAIVFLCLIIPSSFIENLLYRALTIKDFNKSNYVGNLLGRWGGKEICKKEVFSKAAPLSFSGYTVWGPVGYDEYLTNIYGDYMTPPSVNNRCSDHYIRIDSLEDSYISKL